MTPNILTLNSYADCGLSCVTMKSIVHYTDCCYAECHYAECGGATFLASRQSDSTYFFSFFSHFFLGEFSLQQNSADF
jgi:hypothetical protein